MKDHLKNLEKYLKGNLTYNYYKENKHEYYSDCENYLVEHCKDVRWAIDELKALYELVKEMRNKYEKK